MAYFDPEKADPTFIAEFKRQHDLEGRYVVTIVGRITEWKGHDGFIRAIGWVQKQHPEVVGLVAGGVWHGKEAYMEQLTQLAVARLEQVVAHIGQEMLVAGQHRDVALQLLQFLGQQDCVAELAEDRADAPDDTVEDHELLDPTLAPERLLFRLFHEEQVRVYRAIPLSTYCSCSRERVGEMLQRFSGEELEDMVVDGQLWVNCEFCNARYDFDPKDFGAE